MKDPDAIRLLNWKRPTEKNVYLFLLCTRVSTELFVQKAAGDFPTVLYEVISKRSSVTEGSLTVDDVNDILDDLSKNMGKQ